MKNPTSHRAASLFGTLRALPWLVATALAPLALAALATQLSVDAAKSSMIAVFKQEGVAVESNFRKFSGTIAYDAANPAAATAAIDVQTASWDIGDAGYNAEVAKKSWLDSAGFPTATFRSTAVKAGAPGQIVVTGTLVLKGHTQTLSVPVTVKSAAGAAAPQFDGALTVSRKAFAIGDAEWNDVVDDTVTLKFHLVSAARK